MTGPTNLFFLFMNKQTWNGLSKAHKAAVGKASGREFSINAGYAWSTSDMKALKVAKTGKGVEFIQLTAAQAVEFDKVSEAAVLKDLAGLDKKGLKATEIFNALKK